jgi:hypothetical protein
MAFSGLLMIISIAQAQVYSWTDENGNVRFADDYSQVPEKYKKLAVPVGPSKERKEQLEREWAEYERKRAEREQERTIQRGTQAAPNQESEKKSDMMEEIARKFPGLLYEWTQHMGLWIRILASTAYAKEEYSEMAAKIASYYHAKKGHMVCVRFHTGSRKVIAYECR